MNLQDALFNWLQMKIVYEARPNDSAAKNTLDFFATILTEDHKLTGFEISETNETMYCVKYVTDGKAKKQMFDRERVEQLLADIESNPKYNE